MIEFIRKQINTLLIVTQIHIYFNIYLKISAYYSSRITEIIKLQEVEFRKICKVLLLKKIKMSIKMP